MLELNDVTVAFKDGQEMRTVLDTWSSPPSPAR